MSAGESNQFELIAHKIFNNLLGVKHRMAFKMQESSINGNSMQTECILTLDIVDNMQSNHNCSMDNLHNTVNNHKHRLQAQVPMWMRARMRIV